VSSLCLLCVFPLCYYILIWICLLLWITNDYVVGSSIKDQCLLYEEPGMIIPLFQKHVKHIEIKISRVFFVFFLFLYFIFYLIKINICRKGKEISHNIKQMTCNKQYEEKYLYFGLIWMLSLLLKYLIITNK
jgi:hypothetical protein